MNKNYYTLNTTVNITYMLINVVLNTTLNICNIKYYVKTLNINMCVFKKC